MAAELRKGHCSSPGKEEFNQVGEREEEVKQRDSDRHACNKQYSLMDGADEL